MKRKIVLSPHFVDVIPRELKPNTVYISIRYRTAIHSCCCGCGNQVVTPLAPAQWKLIFDGETVSLEPSIGNWSFPCRSHYWIDNNTVVWSDGWSDKRIAAARRKDAADVAEMFGKTLHDQSAQDSASGKQSPRKGKRKLSEKIRKWFGGAAGKGGE